MSGQNNQNRKMQNLINIGKMADDSVGSAELVDNSVGNAALGALQEKTLLYEYDFAVHGGAVSTITLGGKDAGAPTQIPDNAVITNVTIETVTALGTASGTGTVTVGLLGGPTDPDGLVTVENHSATLYAAANTVTSGTPVVTSGKTTAANSVTITVGSNALNAGKFYVWVSYFEGA